MNTIDSISILHELLGYDKPKHPLITLINLDTIRPKAGILQRSVQAEFLYDFFKNSSECDLIYGRQYYDFREGSMIFAKPGQTLQKEHEVTEKAHIAGCFAFIRI